MTNDLEADVLVTGAGLAGLTAAIQLGRAGRRVVCVDPEPVPRNRVGESLDFAAPAILATLGFDTLDLVASQVATRKTGLVAHTTSGEEITLTPPRWTSRRPFSAERMTIHLDRLRFDELLFDTAKRAGVRFRQGSVVDVTHDGEAIQSVTTGDGVELSAKWFIDASGRSRVIGRRLGVEFEAQGPKRIALWADCGGSPGFEGTELWVDTDSDTFSWAWEIPLGPGRLSVGLVSDLERFHLLRSQEHDLPAVFVTELCRLARHESRRPAASFSELRSRSYQPGVMASTAGSNWLLVGEAACMTDPLTSSGVTLAMRHATEAADLIMGHPRPPSRGHLEEYHRRVTGITSCYNRAIERLIYDPSVRRAFGNRSASIAFSTVGFGLSIASTRLNPTTSTRSRLLHTLLNAFTKWTSAWTYIAGRIGDRSLATRLHVGQATTRRT